MNILSNLIFIDQKIGQSIIYFRGDFFDQFFLFITKLGSWQMIILLFVFFSALFYFNKRKGLILPLFVSVLGSGIMTVIIKYLVDRSRPGADIALYVEKLPSFPSAHAALTFALFGYLIYVIFRSSFSLWFKFFSSLIFVLIIITIGFSRLYLGVHFLSDVISGYLTGLLWVLVAMYISWKRNSFKI